MPGITPTSRRRIRPIGLMAVTLLAALALTACGSGAEYFGVRSSAKGAPDSVERKAGLLYDGTAVCIFNRSRDTLSITITGSEGGQDGYENVSGTDNFDPDTQRCMKSDTVTAGSRALAKITVASGESFQLSGFNPPAGFGDPWIEVNGDSRPLAVGSTTGFKIDKHPIQGERLPDVNGWKFFVARIS